jgi:hypothetical protein
MKTIAVTIDDETLKLWTSWPGRRSAGRAPLWSAPRSGISPSASARRVIEERGEIFRKNRKQLAREARSLVQDQARR